MAACKASDLQVLYYCLSDSCFYFISSLNARFAPRSVGAGKAKCVGYNHNSPTYLMGLVGQFRKFQRKCAWPRSAQKIMVHSWEVENNQSRDWWSNSSEMDCPCEAKGVSGTWKFPNQQLPTLQPCPHPSQFFLSQALVQITHTTGARTEWGLL